MGCGSLWWGSAWLISTLTSEPGDRGQGLTGTPTTIRSEFYEAYKRQAKIFNKELKEYNKELNVTLLFVSDPSDMLDPHAQN